MVRIYTRRIPRDPVSIVGTWLQRSQKLPLSCLLVLGGHADADTEEQIFHLIISHAHRWRHLNMVLTSRCDLYLHLTEVVFPQLHSLYIFVGISHSSHSIRNRLSLAAPSLSGAYLVLLIPNVYINAASLPWSRLVDLEITFNSSDEFADVINSLAVLEYCSIHISSEFTLTPQISVFPPSLRHLKVSGPLTNTINLLRHISTPRLLGLSLHAPEGNIPRSIAAERLLESVVALQARSRCQIRRLRVPISFFGYINLRPSDRLSSIEELHLRMERESDSNRQVIRNIANINLLPNLKELHLILHPTVIHPMIHNLLGQFLDMVDFRRQVSGSRQFVRLDCLEIDAVKLSGRPKDKIPITREISERLAKLQRDGLTFMGRIVDREIFPPDRPTSHWDSELDERAWARFGYSDWLVD